MNRVEEAKVILFRFGILVASPQSALNGALVVISLSVVGSDQEVSAALLASVLVASHFAAVKVISAVLRTRPTHAVQVAACHPAMTEAVVDLQLNFEVFGNERWVDTPVNTGAG